MKTRKCIACNGKGHVQVINQRQLRQKKKILELYQKGYGIRETQRIMKLNAPFFKSRTFHIYIILNMLASVYNS